MNIIKTWALMIFTLGIVILAKYIPFKPWVEENVWICFPMIVFGCLGIVYLFDGRH